MHNEWFEIEPRDITQRAGKLVNAPPAEREVSGSSLEGGENHYLDHLKPKFEFRISHGFAVFSPGR